MNRLTATAVAAIALAWVSAASAAAPIEDRLGDAVRATVICADDPGSRLELVAGKPVLVLWAVYCDGIARELARPVGQRYIDAAVEQGWYTVAYQSAIIACFQRLHNIQACTQSEPAVATAADELVPGAMRRAHVQSKPYIRKVQTAVAALIARTF